MKEESVFNTRNKLLKERVQLFLSLIGDIVSYKEHEQEREKLFIIPPQVKKVVKEVISSVIVSSLLIDKEEIKTINKDSKEKKQIKIIKKLVQNQKRSINSTCFNQRNVINANQFFFTPNERKIINGMLVEKMFFIIKESLYESVELKEKNLFQKSNTLVLSKPNLNYLPPKKMRKSSSLVIHRQRNFAFVEDGNGICHYDYGIYNFKKDENIKDDGFTKNDEYFHLLKNNLSLPKIDTKQSTKKSDKIIEERKIKTTPFILPKPRKGYNENDKLSQTALDYDYSNYITLFKCLKSK